MRKVYLIGTADETEFSVEEVSSFLGILAEDGLGDVIHDIDEAMDYEVNFESSEQWFDEIVKRLKEKGHDAERVELQYVTVPAG